MWASYLYLNPHYLAERQREVEAQQLAFLYE
jgi:hypothetical protein